MKIMAINAGSSSLKFQLLNMPSEEVLASGIIERIGMKDSVFSIKYDSNRYKDILDIPTHKEAVYMLLEKLVELNVVRSLNDIEGIGHRIVHGGEKFTDSVIITDEVIDVIEEISHLAPLHNPANLKGILAMEKLILLTGIL